MIYFVFFGLVLFGAFATFGADLCDRAMRLLRVIEKRNAFEFETTPRSIISRFFTAIYFYTVGSTLATLFWLVAPVLQKYNSPFNSPALARRCVVAMITLGAARVRARCACCEEHADTYLLAIDDAVNVWVSCYGKDAMGYEAFTAKVNKFLGE